MQWNLAPTLPFLALVSLSSCKSIGHPIPPLPSWILVTTESIPDAKLTRSEVLHLSKLVIEKMSQNLVEAELREIMYSPDTHEWVVFYDRRPKGIGNHFTVYVNDQNQSTRFVGGM